MSIVSKSQTKSACPISASPQPVSLLALLFPAYARVLAGHSAPTPLQLVRDDADA